MCSESVWIRLGEDPAPDCVLSVQCLFLQGMGGASLQRKVLQPTPRGR